MNALVDAVEDIFPFVGNPETETPKPREWFATQSQQAGLVRLHALADLFARVGDSSPAGFKPLLRCLMIGQSGAGKSTLAREFAQQKKWAFTTIDCGSWLIQGANAKPATLRVVRDFIRSSVRSGGYCCLFLDELCKLVVEDARSGWYCSVYAECLSLVDADERLYGHEWTPEDVKNYRNRCYLIAGGAFSHALREARQAQKRGGLGFVDAPKAATHSSKIREALPEEIYQRFPEQIVLESPTRQDYARAIEMIHEDLHVERAVPIKQLLDEAESSEAGTRWLTQYVTRVLLANPEALPVREAQCPASKPKGYDFFSPDILSYCRMITTDSFALRGALGRLYAEYRRNRAAIDQGACRAFAKHILGETGDYWEEKILLAICASNACAEITADDSAVIDPLLAWRELAWDGLRQFPNELEHYEMLDLVTQSWDLVSRVAELRGRLNAMVAAGRFGGVL